MPPPSYLAIATSVVQRLLKEEVSYQKELSQQETQTRSLEEKIQNGQASDDGNDAFMLRQRQQAMEETKAIFKPLRQRIDDAVGKLEEQITLREESGAPPAEMEKAKDVLAQARAERNGGS